MNEKPNNTGLPPDGSSANGSSADGSEKDLTGALDALETLLDANRDEPARRSPPTWTAFGEDSPEGDEERLTLPDSENEAFQALIRQLNDEIQIIVQSRVEEALRAVTRDITHQVKTHMNIMLPAFLDGLAHLAFRKDGEHHEQE